MSAPVVRLWFADATDLEVLRATEDRVDWTGDAMPVLIVAADAAVAEALAKRPALNDAGSIDGRERFSTTAEALARARALGARYLHLVAAPFADFAPAVRRLAKRAATAEVDVLLADCVTKTAFRFHFGAASAEPGLADLPRTALLTRPEACWLRLAHAEHLLARAGEAPDASRLALLLDLTLPTDAAIERSALLIGATHAKPMATTDFPLDALLARPTPDDDARYARAISLTRAGQPQSLEGEHPVLDAALADVLGREIVINFDDSPEKRRAAIACHPDPAEDIAELWRARSAALRAQLDREQGRTRRALRRNQKLKDRLDALTPPEA